LSGNVLSLDPVPSYGKGDKDSPRRSRTGPAIKRPVGEQANIGPKTLEIAIGYC
jgi:hypothetical protein